MKKYIVVCDVILEAVGVETLLEARVTRDSFDRKYPHDPSENSPALIYPVDQYFAYIMKQNELPIPEGIETPENLNSIVIW